MKRAIDIIAAIAGLTLLSPILVGVAGAIWLQDRQSPFYVATRAGRGSKPFKMYKFRSMVVNAEATGVSSTGNNDARITTVGRFIRATKIDELPQLINVLRGDMSLVGPRPNTERAVAGYTSEELPLTSIRPGITDLASIVFADEGAILAEEPDPDLAYEQLIRPWKSRLGLVFVQNPTTKLYLRILRLTALNSLNRDTALSGVVRTLTELGASPELTRTASRMSELVPTAPPGLSQPIADLPND